MPSSEVTASDVTASEVMDIETPVGVARVHLQTPVVPLTAVRASKKASRARLLVLGHGAGGGIEAVDLVAVAQAAAAAGWWVALVEQPWRVAGRKVAVAPPRLDQAWIAVLAKLRADARFAQAFLVVGGRSAGARVVCRTAVTTGADAALCLAFPLHPPGRPASSRAGELQGAGVPVLVVQGAKDAFGSPTEVESAATPTVQVVAVRGDHGLKAEPQTVADAVISWLAECVATASR